MRMFRVPRVENCTFDKDDGLHVVLTDGTTYHNETADRLLTGGKYDVTPEQYNAWLEYVETTMDEEV